MRIWYDANFDNMELVWMDASVLDELWRKDSDCILSWKGDPRDQWFMKRETREGLRLPEVSVTFDDNIPSIEIHSGRHRTRWLISNLHKARIPVAIHESQVDRAMSIGLVVGRIVDDEEI
jgi:hypothetical protein